MNKRLLVGLVVGAVLSTACSKKDTPDAAPRQFVTDPVLAAKGTRVVISPSPLDFGAVTIGTNMTIVVQNTGPEPLTVQSVGFCATTPTSSEFTLTPPTLPVTLAADGTLAVTVRYTPIDVSATDQGCVTVVSDDPSQPSIDVAITGDGMTVAQASTCATCHGNRSQYPLPTPGWTIIAPPRIAYGNYTETSSDVRVGAHHNHMRSSLATSPQLAKPFYCNQCHLWPPPAFHDRDTVQVAWSPLATANGALTPVLTYSTALDPVTGRPMSATCSNVYCHGATLSGGTSTTPVWTQVDGAQVTCGSCHGAPPPVPHPQGTPGLPLECGGCHDGYTATTVNLETHVDGKLNVNGGTCTSCHGDDTRSPPELAPAPPRSTAGGTETTDPGVGAHQSHLTGTTYRNTPVECTDCHTLPQDISHASEPLQITFSPFAKDGLPALFEPATLRCSSTYCHGGTISGGTNTRPVWNVVDGTQAACGTCHGLPPLTPHPANTNCGGCHGTGYSLTSVDKQTHLNALLELETSCTGCHGDASRTPASIAAAPPVDTAGNTAPTAPGVGAHQAHLAGTSLRASPVACSDCHKVPTDAYHATRPLDLTFSAFAKTGGLTPTFDPSTTSPTALTCASTYCHGATLSGGSNKKPVWTGGAPQAACGTCHGAPPPAPHPTSTSCGICHTGYGPSSVNAATHLDGTLQVNTSCTSCHGDPARAPASIAAAPPHDTQGNVATTAPGVGAHQAHLAGTSLAAAPIACAECHVVPTNIDHATQPLVLAWGPLATRGGAAPAFDATAHSCASTYCHGATLAGGSNKQPVWTGGAPQAACGTCHGAPPPLPHPASTNCGVCHTGYGASSVNRATHLDGTLQVNTTCTSCHGDEARAPAAIAPAPPLDTSGRSDSPAVGAHEAHLTGNNLRASPIACSDCHTVPTTIAHATQPLDLTWGSLARTNGVNPSFDSVSLTCANYCHGATLGGGTRTTPAWTDASAACGTCHGAPPPAPHPANPSCGNCHTGYTLLTVNLAKHINGEVDIDNLSCSSCHGSSARAAAVAPAPPVDSKGNSATTARGVGAHQAHLGNGTLTNALSCAACHATPTSLTHANGVSEVSFGVLAKARGANATWNGLTCANYCHGSTLGSGSNHNPSWTVVNGTQDACGTCHGSDSSGRPSTGRHTSESEHRVACTTCHAGSSSPDKANHVNGVVDMNPSLRWNATNRSCSPSCHGSESWGGTVRTASPTVLASPGTVLFGDVVVGKTVTQPVTIQNLGTSSLTVSGLSLCTGSAPLFSLSSTAGFTVAAGAKQTVNVTYAPTAAAASSGCFRIASNDPVQPSAVVNLVGRGLPAVPAVTATPTELAFGTVYTGTTTTKVLTIANAGNAPLVVGSVGLCSGTTAGFSVPTAGFTVQPGSSVNLNVAFAPVAAGSVSVASCVSIASNDPAFPTLQVALSGTATTPLPSIAVTPNPLAFGTVNTGSTTTRALTVTNAGTAALTVTSVTPCAGTSGEFTVSPSSLSVAAGGSATVNVTFKPTVAGAVAAGSCIAFTSNAPAYTVGLTGTAVTPSGPIISATPNPVAFGSVHHGDTKTLTVQVANTGTSTLSVNSVTRCSGTSSEFTVSSSSFSVSPGSTRSLSVAYRPSGDGSDTGCISISSNATNGSPYAVPVSGTGY